MADAPDYLTSLIQARDNAAARLAEILASPKPSYTVHGHSVSWTEYQEMLGEQIKAIDQLIAQGIPFEFVTAMR